MSMSHSCCSKQKVKRGLWSPEEDRKLINYVSTYGHGCWSAVPKLAGIFNNLIMESCVCRLNVYVHAHIRVNIYVCDVELTTCFCRAAEVWKELQIKVD